MNELFFNWHKRLNIGKVILFSIVIITLLLLIFFLIFFKKEFIKKDSLDYIYNAETNTTTFFDKNHSISLELSNTYELKQYTPSNEYLIELRSNKNLNIFTSFKNKIEGKSLIDIVSADKLAFTQSFNTTSNLSEVKEIPINDYTACTYSFHYLDEVLGTTFFIQVAWIEIDNNYYVFDIEFPLDDLNNYVNIVTDTLFSFKKYKL